MSNVSGGKSAAKTPSRTPSGSSSGTSTPASHAAPAAAQSKLAKALKKALKGLTMHPGSAARRLRKENDQALLRDLAERMAEEESSSES